MIPAAPLEVRRLVPPCAVPAAAGRPEGTVRQAEEDLAVHLGEAPQPEPPEQVVGVVDGAVVGADDVPRADRVVVAVDPLVAAGAPAGVAHEEGGPVVHPGQDLLEQLEVRAVRVLRAAVDAVAGGPVDGQPEELVDPPGQGVAGDDLRGVVPGLAGLHHDPAPQGARKRLTILPNADLTAPPRVRVGQQAGIDLHDDKAPRPFRNRKLLEYGVNLGSVES